MTAEMWIIALVRVAGSLPVLRWPFYGSILAILIDLSDLFLMNLLDLGGVRDYQTFDKALDQVYMAAFLFVAWRWGGVERAVAVALYGFRMLGFLAFELTGSRDVLLLFPNLFEFWFVFCAARRHFGWEKKLPLTLRLPALADGTGSVAVWHAKPLQPAEGVIAVEAERWNAALIIPVTALVVAKLVQEYAIHHERWLDNITAVDAVESIWRFVVPF
jgi:hypothetical protein